MILNEITRWLQTIAPLEYQESYDNSGLQLGNPDMEVSSCLLCIDVTEEIIDEAFRIGANLIISHHPLIFNNLKKITGSNLIERTIIKAIKNNIAIYTMHTNLDSIKEGVNDMICNKLGLKDTTILLPVKNQLMKLVTFVPEKHAKKVREGLFNAGAGMIGNYDSCSFNLKGEGTFRGLENTNPFVGEQGKLHYEPEVKVETIFPRHIKNNLIRALIEAHPYEEVAYDIYPLDNSYPMVGMGMLGEVTGSMTEIDFLDKLKQTFQVPSIRHSRLLDKPVKIVAVCGGSGSFLIHDAIKAGADVFVTADFKYHQFFESDGRIVLIDIGHYESEQFTKDIFYDILTKKFPNFAVYLTEVNTNPINYY